MVEAINIEDVLAGLSVLHDRTPDTPEDEVAGTFATLGQLGGAGIFTGRFSGESRWERHGKGDELVHVLAGQTTLEVLTDDGSSSLDLKAGMLAVVPQGCWHRFRTTGVVTILTATPQPTDHSTAADPRQEG